MGKKGSQKRDKNSTKLPNTPANNVSDGRDIEFSSELADHEDLEAQAQSKAADARAKNKKQ